MSTTTSRWSPKAKGKHEPRTSKDPFPGSTFTFLALPAEVRIQIYHLVLPERRVCRPNASVRLRRNLYGRRTPQPETLALARTCKQIEAELSSIHFGDRSFHFESVYDMYHYLDKIGPGRRFFITSVRVRLDKNECVQTRARDNRSTIPMRELLKASFNLLGECKSLKTLYLQVNRGTTMYRSSQNRSSRNVHNLLALRSEGVFAAVHGLENLDLRVRESPFTGKATPDLFECPIEANTWSAFTREHLQSFEKSLRRDMRSSGNTALSNVSKGESRTRKSGSDPVEVTLRTREGVKRIN
ncbi:uncharacterized protein BP5553_06537 [Venustampulla echinocandica]|uniref:F-box domain-containing protein n=1 Tax=Venustampulla echinocandica TaxID=2656787 RepID=A0A370TK79_9HELO|nr:uncharacterized protein BP5553_06537 [Venustampulla echinocandica]RDL35925.1 hypothetical protein BP5553_06537 [Venustampulla echinocandica]